MLGRLVDGKYRILRLLGQGGMGSVYEAEAVEPGVGLEPRVALKLLHPEVLDDDGKRVARFRREARAASAVDTEHIARMLDFGTDPELDAPYMVMELLRGEDLAQVLDRGGRLPADTALRIAAQVCLALDKAHGARIIHRDIKPANIFLARRASGGVVVKVLDFGIAKIKPEPGRLTSGLTQSGNVLGSPRYMSPEQAKGTRAIDFRTDLWSLGMVLYHALSGHPPHHQLRSLVELILALTASPPRLLPERVPGVPPEVVSLVHTALELDPARRFPSAVAMLDAMRPLLPGGWSLDEDMLAQPAGEARRRGPAETVQLTDSGPVDAFAETKTAEPSDGRTRTGTRA